MGKEDFKEELLCSINFQDVAPGQRYIKEYFDEKERLGKLYQSMHMWGCKWLQKLK